MAKPMKMGKTTDAFPILTGHATKKSIDQHDPIDIDFSLSKEIVFHLSDEDDHRLVVKRAIRQFVTVNVHADHARAILKKIGVLILLADNVTANADRDVQAIKMSRFGPNLLDGVFLVQRGGPLKLRMRRKGVKKRPLGKKSIKKG